MSGDQLPKISGSPYSPNRLHSVGKKGGKAADPKGGSPSLTPKDKVSISGQAPQAAETKGVASDVRVSADDMARYLKMLEQEPDIREDKVDAARRRLDSGDYGPDALDKLLDGLEEDLGLPPIG